MIKIPFSKPKGVSSEILQETFQKILSFFDQYKSIPNLVDTCQMKTDEFKERYQKGQTLDGLLPEVFAFVKSLAYHSKVKITDSIIYNAIDMFNGFAVESKSEENRHLSIMFLAYLYHIAGLNVHVYSASHALSERFYKDYKIIQRAYTGTETLYYGSLRNEIFNYLEKCSSYEIKNHFKKDVIIINNDDYHLIDYGLQRWNWLTKELDDSSEYQSISKFVKHLTVTDFVIDDETSKIDLSQSGIEKANEYFGIDNILNSRFWKLRYLISRGLCAYYLLHRGKDYEVSEGKIVCLDKSTGELKQDWNFVKALHPFLEVKHNLSHQLKIEKVLLSSLTSEFLQTAKHLHIISSRASFWSSSYKTLYNQETSKRCDVFNNNRTDLPNFYVPSEKVLFRSLLSDLTKSNRNKLLICCNSKEQTKTLYDFLRANGHSFSEPRDFNTMPEFNEVLKKDGLVLISRDNYLKLYLAGLEPIPDVTVIGLGRYYNTSDEFLREYAIGQKTTVETKFYVINSKIPDVGEYKSPFLTRQDEKRYRKGLLKTFEDEKPFAKLKREIVNDILDVRFQISGDSQNNGLYLKKFLYDFVERKIHQIFSNDSSSLASFLKSCGLDYLLPNLSPDNPEHVIANIYEEVLKKLENVNYSNKLQDFLTDILKRYYYVCQQLDWAKEEYKLSVKQYGEALDYEYTNLIFASQEYLFLRILHHQDSDSKRFDYKEVNLSFSNGDSYEGGYSGGRKLGHGNYTTSDGDRYCGHFRNGVLSGLGSLIRKDGETVLGFWEKGVLVKACSPSHTSGQSILFKTYSLVGEELVPDYDQKTFKTVSYSDGSKYEGEFLGDVKHGRGKLTWSDGAVYEGDWLKGDRTGRGIFTWVNGDVYEGEFLDNKLHGFGIKRYSDGRIEEGIWESDVLVSPKEKQAETSDSKSELGRNDLCTCGSGKRYKNCHGRQNID